MVMVEGGQFDQNPILSIYPGKMPCYAVVFRKISFYSRIFLVTLNRKKKEELSRFMGSIEKSGLSSFEKAWLMPEEAPRHFKRYTGLFCDWAAKNFVSLLYDGDTNPFKHAVHPFYILVKDTHAKPIEIGSSAPDTLPCGIKEALDTLAIDFQAAFDDTHGFHKFIKAIVPFYETIYNRTTDRRYTVGQRNDFTDLLSIMPLFGAAGVGQLTTTLSKQGMRALFYIPMAKGLTGGRLLRYVARGMSAFQSVG